MKIFGNFMKKRLLIDAYLREIVSKRQRGLSAVEIVIAVAVSLGLALVVFVFFGDELKNSILPAMSRTINNFFK